MPAAKKNNNSEASIFGLVVFVLKSRLGIARQCSREKFAILSIKPRSRVRILIYRTWTISRIRLSRSLEQATYKGVSPPGLQSVSEYIFRPMGVPV